MISKLSGSRLGLSAFWAFLSKEVLCFYIFVFSKVGLRLEDKGFIICFNGWLVKMLGLIFLIKNKFISQNYGSANFFKSIMSQFYFNLSATLTTVATVFNRFCVGWTFGDGFFSGCAFRLGLG